MSLGGYKFAGYKVTKPEGAMDAEWALLCHKCRVKAFVESNNASGAGWEFDQTSGQISFGTYGNVIHRLDDIGYNYVSFFKHGTDNAYFAIMTMGYYGQSADLANGKVYLVPINQGTNSGTYMGIGATMFCRISRTQLTPSNVLVDIANEIRAVPCGYFMCNSNFANGANPTTWDASATYLDSSQQGFWAGFAMKGTNISSFLSYYPASYSINTCHFSIGGYSSLMNLGDTNNVFVCNASDYSQTAVNERLYRRTTSGLMSTYGFITLSDNGSVASGGVTSERFSHYIGDINYYPFSSIKIIARNYTYNNFAKGIVSIDFLAWNSPSSSSNIPQIKSTKANGNYLCVTAINNNSGVYCSSLAGNSSTSIWPVLYCGWDPSNPDITQESAWTAYTE